MLCNKIKTYRITIIKLSQYHISCCNPLRSAVLAKADNRLLILFSNLHTFDIQEANFTTSICKIKRVKLKYAAKATEKI